MRINPITLVGIALIILGVVAFAYQGITYTSREKIIDIGPIQATADTQKTIPLSPLLGGFGACRRDRAGRSWSQEVVARQAMAPRVAGATPFRCFNALFTSV